MGWTSVNRPTGMGTNVFFTNQFGYDNEKGSGRVLLCKSTFTESYMAFEIVSKQGDRKVAALVCLIRHSRGFWNFDYKDMDETMGPGITNCPKEVLKLLTPTDNETANRWRDLCWGKVNRTKLKEGLIIRFKKPVTFRGGDKHSIFRVAHAKKHMFAANGEISACYEISRRYLKSSKWELLDPRRMKKEDLPPLLGLDPSLDTQIADVLNGKARRIKRLKPVCPVCRKVCEEYDDCHNRTYCHLK